VEFTDLKLSLHYNKLLRGRGAGGIVAHLHGIEAIRQVFHCEAAGSNAAVLLHRAAGHISHHHVAVPSPSKSSVTAPVLLGLGKSSRRLAALLPPTERMPL
jgi:hypothetical protein